MSAEREYGVAFDIDGTTYHVLAGHGLAGAHTRLGNLMRHHARNNVEAERYRIVVREVGAWAPYEVPE